MCFIFCKLVFSIVGNKYYALEKNNPEMIICPRTHSVMLRDDVDYKSLSFYCYLYYDNNKISIGNYSLNDILVEKLEKYYDNIDNSIFLYTEDSLGIYAYLELIINDKYFLLFDNEIYLASDQFVNEIIAKINK